MNSIKPLLTGLVFLAGLFYLGAIINAGIISIRGTGELNQLFSSAIIVIGGILSTNLGAVIGYTFTPPGQVAAAKLPQTFMGLRPTVNVRKPATKPGVAGNTNDDGNGNQDNSPSQKAQIFACYFYVISLIIALVFYLLASNKGKPLPVIEELSKTLLGVFVGALTVSLIGKPQIR